MSSIKSSSLKWDSDLGKCHEPDIETTVIEPAESIVRSFYDKPYQDMEREEQKKLPDLDWCDPYTAVFDHLIIKESNVNETASGYLFPDLGTDPDCLKTNESLNIKYKNLCHKLGAFASNNLIKSLRTKSLIFNNCGINHVDFYCIVKALYDSPSITMLDVSNNDIGALGAYHLSQLLLELDIPKIMLDSNNIGDFGCSCILASILNNEVVYLSLSNNKITDKCIGPLNDLLKGEKSKVKDLFLSHNQIGQSLSKSSKDFKLIFANNISLDNVDLSWNNINGDQAIGIFVGLKNNNAISILSLSHNGIDDSVCKSIGTCLKQNHSLQSLDISCNFIGFVGAKLIAAGLKHNDCLNTLKIGKNPINRTGVDLLLNAINNDKSAITHLDFTGLAVTPEFVALLEEIGPPRELDVTHGRAIAKSIND